MEAPHLSSEGDTRVCTHHTPKHTNDTGSLSIPVCLTALGVISVEGGNTGMIEVLSRMHIFRFAAQLL